MSLLFSTLTIGILIAGIIFGLSYLPVSTGLPTELATVITSIAGFINAFSYLIPFSSIFAGIIIIVGFEFAILSVKVVLWAIRTVRGGGS